VSAETISTQPIEVGGPRANPFAEAGRRLLSSQEIVLFVCVVALWIYLSQASDVFLTERNIGTLLTSISMIAVTAIGMTLLIIAREVDLSVGSVQAFVGVIAMQTLNATENLAVGIAVALLVGAVIGLINATLTLRLGISSFVVTLAMFSIIRGAAYTTTNAAVQNKHKLPEFRTLGIGAIIDNPIRIPWAVVIMFVVFVVFYLVLNRTTFGRYVYAVGGNPRASVLSGIPVGAIKTACFVITSTLAGLSAFMLIARMNSGQNNAGFGFELQVIGAVLLGGASLLGGKGTLVGTLLATILLGTINNGITLLKWDTNWQTAIPGIVIVVAVLLDSLRRRLTGEE
jgi:ribose transport system permease protein